MKNKCCVAFALVFLLTGFNQAQQPKTKSEKLPPKVAPVYSLPKDGTWVRYDFFYRDRRGKALQGTMRIKSDGRQEEDGKLYRWIEIKMEQDAVLTRVGRFLIEEEAVRSKQPLEKHVIKALHQEGEKNRVTLLKEKEISDYFTMGVEGSLHEIATSELLKTRLGDLPCRVVSTKGQGYQRPALSSSESGAKKGSTELARERPLEYKAWFNDEIPFGWARFEIWAQQPGGATIRMFSAEVVEKGP